MKPTRIPFLGGDESVWPCIEAVRAYFYHVLCLKQKEQASSGYAVFCVAEIEMSKIEMDI